MSRSSESPPFIPLFRQVCLLAAVCGIASFSRLDTGIIGLAVLLPLTLPPFSKVQGPARPAVLLLFFALGAGYAALREPVPAPLPEWAKQTADEEAPFASPPLRLRALATEVEPLAGGRLRLVLEHAAPAQGGMPSLSVPYEGKIVFTFDSPTLRPLPGQELEATVRLAPLRGFANPGLWNSDDYWKTRGIGLRAYARGKAADAKVYGEGSFSARLRRNLTDAFVAALPKEGEAPAPGAAVLPALVYDDRSFTSPEDNDRIRRSTLAHSFALSGMHLGFLVGLAALAVGACGAAFPLLWERIPRPRAILLVSLPPAAAYLWLGGFPVSLVRAAVMLLFWALLLSLHRPKVLMDGLLAAIAVILLYDPAALHDVSFQLSATATAGIALAVPPLSRFLRPLLPNSKDSLPRRFGKAAACGGVSMFALSALSQIILAPVLADAFGAAGLWFPLNLLWLPVLGLWVMPASFAGLAAAACGMQNVAALFLQAAAFPADLLLRLLAAIDNAGLLLSPPVPRPHPLSAAGYWLLLLCAAWAFRKSTRRKSLLLLPLACLFLLLPPAAAALRDQSPRVALTLVDVGQGQAVLVEWNGLPGLSQGFGASGRVLVDGGGFASDTFDSGRNILAPLLTQGRLPRLDAVVYSHPDADHLKGLLHLLENFSVSLLAGNGDTPAPALAERLEKISASAKIPERVLRDGDILPLGPDLYFEVLQAKDDEEGSEPSFKSESGNNRSLVMRLVWNEKPLALLCGDAEKKALAELVSKKGAQALAAEVLVLPHHGSKNSAFRPFYEAVAPRTALASCGFRNQWGFPSEEIKEILNGLGVPLYSTARHGQLRLEWLSFDTPPLLFQGRDSAGNPLP